LRHAFGLPVGLSDHTEGLAVAVAAVARGAAVVEKHFTLDRTLPGPDHMASLEPGELKAMITAIRTAESALGSAIKMPAASEQKNMSVARKSLVALAPIRSGEFFTPQNLGAKRPGSGVSPMEFWDWLDRRATRDFQPDELIGL
jgi:sialic acid synthase SpsE